MDKEFSILHEILSQQFSILKEDVMIYLKNSHKLLQDHLNNLTDDDNVDSNKSALRSFSRYMIDLFNMFQQTTEYVSDMIKMSKITARSLSMNGVFNDLNDVDDKISICSELTLTGELNDCCNVKTPSLPKPNKADNVKAATTFNQPYLPCDRVNISNFKVGMIIPDAFVSSIESNKITFHICVPSLSKSNLLCKLYELNERQCYKCLPANDKLFGIKIDGGLVRAIRFPNLPTKIFLPDFGDYVDYDCEMDFYYLTIDEQNFPAQAILCKLHLSDFDEKQQKDQSEILTSLLYKQSSFKIHEIKHNILMLEIVSKDSMENVQKESDKSKNLTLAYTSTFDENSSEDLDIFNDDPVCTSNALKAVLGYVPKDDQRICRFYDPEIDGCFKGSNCRQLHVPKLKEYWTKDVVPAKVYSEKSAKTLFQPFQVLQVTVTHIKSLEYFYGNIIDAKSSANEPHIWRDSDIEQTDHLKISPYIYDIVLALFSDGYWYRAQIVDVDETGNIFHILYVDYGNTDKVPLKNLAKCKESIAKLPPQAIEFRIANIRSKSDRKETYQLGITLLTDLILNQSLRLQVVSDYKDLVVRFLDEPFSETTQLLSDANCVEMIDMLLV